MKVEVAPEAIRKAKLVGPVIYQKHVKGKAEVGELVEVEGEGGKLCALWDETGPVRLRVLFWHECPGSVEDAVREALVRAYRTREANGSAFWEAYRLVNSDGDSFPGLIVDVYKDLAVLQSSSLAVDKHIMTIARIVKEVTGVETVAEKSSQRVRAKVGLPPREGLLIGNKKETVVDEEGVKFKVSIEGQKTGLYLDQRENRAYAERFSPGTKFLDAFSYTGGFGLHALKAGAREVTFVDEDPWALKVLRENLKINNFDERKVKIVREDIWRYLKVRLKRRETTEVASYDPPAFVPSKEKLEEGMRDYMRLYVFALKLAEPSSLVMLSSCSQPFTRDMFLWTIAKASYFSNKEVRVFAVRGASRDHVFPPGSTYMEYLKFAALSVL